MNNMELPRASGGATKQGEAGARKPEGKMVGDEARWLVQDSLGNPEMEKVLKVDGEGLILQDPEDSEAMLQNKEDVTRGRDRVREAPPKRAGDTLALQVEGLDLKEKKEPGRSRLAGQVQEDTPRGNDHRISVDDILKLMKKEGRDEEEEEEEEGPGPGESSAKETLRAPPIRPLSIWSQYREKIKSAVNKQKVGFPHLGYFTKVFGQTPSTAEIKKKSWDEVRKWDRREPGIPRITSTNFEEEHDKKPSEEAVDMELEDVYARSPESLLEISPEAEDETKMEEARAALSHLKKPQRGSIYQDDSAIAGTTSSVWSMGQRISHDQELRAKQNAQEKIYKQKLLKHERDIKAAVPLPLQEKIEEEVLAILLETLKDYQQKLGSTHPFTIQMQERVDKLYVQLHARGMI